MGERYLKSVRLLAECMQGFERYSSESIRACGLTPPQFDLIATLGNTPGMSCKELGEKTLITKGTLTGVLDRLEQKGLVERTRNGSDKRSFFVRLTATGDALFKEIFPTVISHSKVLFDAYSADEFTVLEAQLAQLKERIARGSAAHAARQQNQHKDSD